MSEIAWIDESATNTYRMTWVGPIPATEFEWLSYSDSAGESYNRPPNIYDKKQPFIEGIQRDLLYLFAFLKI